MFASLATELIWSAGFCIVFAISDAGLATVLAGNVLVAVTGGTSAWPV